MSSKIQIAQSGDQTQNKQRSNPRVNDFKTGEGSGDFFSRFGTSYSGDTSSKGRSSYTSTEVFYQSENNNRKNNDQLSAFIATLNDTLLTSAFKMP